MHFSQDRERFFCSVLHRSAISYVASDTVRVYPLAFKFDQSGIEGIYLNIGQHHPHVCSTKGTRQGKSDAASPAGYERALSLKFAHLPPHDLDRTTDSPHEDHHHPAPPTRERSLALRGSDAGSC